MTWLKAEFKLIEICSFVLSKQGSSHCMLDSATSSSKPARFSSAGVWRRRERRGSQVRLCREPLVRLSLWQEAGKNPCNDRYDGKQRGQSPGQEQLRHLITAASRQPPSRRARRLPPLAAARSQPADTRDAARSPLQKSTCHPAHHETTPLPPASRCNPMTSSKTQHSYTRHRLVEGTACKAGGPASRVRGKTPEGGN